jgi:hypothetical protein
MRMTIEDLDAVNATLLWINLKCGVLPADIIQSAYTNPPGWKRARTLSMAPARAERLPKAGFLERLWTRTKAKFTGRPHLYGSAGGEGVRAARDFSAGISRRRGQALQEMPALKVTEDN